MQPNHALYDPMPTNRDQDLKIMTVILASGLPNDLALIDISFNSSFLEMNHSFKISAILSGFLSNAPTLLSVT